MDKKREVRGGWVVAAARRRERSGSNPCTTRSANRSAGSPTTRIATTTPSSPQFLGVFVGAGTEVTRPYK